MANKVTVFIHTTDGRVIPLSNDRMSIMTAEKCIGINWKSVFPNIEIGKYDLIISDWTDENNPYWDKGYIFVEHFENQKVAEYVLEVCRKKLSEQYDRMKMIRVAKKNGLDDRMIINLELAYHNSENYEIYIDKLLKEL